MPYVGQTISNPITGETITFERTAADTGGAAVELLFEVTAGGAPPAPHVHPEQTETFVVHEGRCRAVIDGEERILGPGEAAVVPPGATHFWAAETDVRMTVTLEPALDADRFFERLFAIANDGRVNRKGMPNPLEMAVLVDDHPGLIYLAGPPLKVQRAAFAGLAKVGRLLGRGRPAPAPAPQAA
jgi:quercetin dioxygenase-like cupin family protein